MCEAEQDHEEFVEYLKNDPEFIQKLRGKVPDINLEEAKKRLFQRVFKTDHNGRSHPEK